MRPSPATADRAAGPCPALGAGTPAAHAGAAARTTTRTRRTSGRKARGGLRRWTLSWTRRDSSKTWSCAPRTPVRRCDPPRTRCSRPPRPRIPSRRSRSGCWTCSRRSVTGAGGSRLSNGSTRSSRGDSRNSRKQLSRPTPPRGGNDPTRRTRSSSCRAATRTSRSVAIPSTSRPAWSTRRVSWRASRPCYRGTASSAWRRVSTIGTPRRFASRRFSSSESSGTPSPPTLKAGATAWTSSSTRTLTTSTTGGSACSSGAASSPDWFHFAKTTTRRLRCTRICWCSGYFKPRGAPRWTPSTKPGSCCTRVICTSASGRFWTSRGNGRRVGPSRSRSLPAAVPLVGI